MDPTTFDEPYIKIQREDTTKLLPQTTLLQTTKIRNSLIVVIGPDGHQRGSIPTTVRETDDIYVLVYSSTDQPITIELSNCERPGTNVLGAPAKVRSKGQPVEVNAELKAYGHCSAQKSVSIKATPGDGKACGATTTALQTLAVYRLTVGLGAALYAFSQQQTGVDIGTGGTPNRAFQHDVSRGMQTKAIVGYFPVGYSDDLDSLSWRRVFLGTAIDTSSALSSANLLGGYELTTGLSVFVGLQFAEEHSSLSGGLKDGAIYTDDSSKLPTQKDWVLTFAPFAGIAVTADLLAKIVK